MRQDSKIIIKRSNENRSYIVEVLRPSYIRKHEKFDGRHDNIQSGGGEEFSYGYSIPANYDDDDDDDKNFDLENHGRDSLTKL